MILGFCVQSICARFNTPHYRKRQNVMSRSPFQVLVLPYRITPDNEVLYALFKREPSSGGYWQGIAGGGENSESPLETAERETLEEAGIDQKNEYIKLDSYAMIPVSKRMWL